MVELVVMDCAVLETYRTPEDCALPTLLLARWKLILLAPWAINRETFVTNYLVTNTGEVDVMDCAVAAKFAIQEGCALPTLLHAKWMQVAVDFGRLHSNRNNSQHCEMESVSTGRRGLRWHSRQCIRVVAMAGSPCNEFDKNRHI